MAFNRELRNKLVLLFFQILILSLSLGAQNLILNPSIEELHKESSSYFLSNVKNWHNPTMGTPDIQTKKFNWGDNGIIAHSGNAFFGFGLSMSRPKYTEYIMCTINNKLQKDSLYCLYFYVSIKNRKQSNGLSYFPQLDVYFSKKRIKQYSYKPLYPKYIASISNIGNSPISNIGFWEKRSAVYKAKGNEKYIVFGTFSNSFTYQKIIEGNVKDIVYIFLDDFSLTSISDSSQCSCNKVRKDFSKIEISKDSIETDKSLLKPGLVVRFNKLHFVTNSADLDTNSITELQELVKIMQSDTSLQIRINGHTDSKGYAKSNLRLSEKRAKAVVNYLILHGINKRRLSYKGYGSNYPLATNMTEEGRAINRRVEFEVIAVDYDK